MGTISNSGNTSNSTTLFQDNAGNIISGQWQWNNTNSSPARIYSIKTDGTQYQTLHSFALPTGTFGGHALPCLIAPDGMLYGVYGNQQTSGTANYGYTFKMAPDGSNFSILASGNVSTNLIWHYQQAELIYVRLNQTILGPTVINKTLGDPDFALPQYILNSGLPTSFSNPLNSNVAVLNSNMISIKGIGTTTLRVMQAGNDDYNPAYSIITINVSPVVTSTQSPWAWMGGPSTNKTYTAGDNVTSPVNRDLATSWTDASGNLWLFGGYDASNYFNDLWKYTTNTAVWSLVNGSSVPNQPGVHGAIGQFDPSYHPDARQSTKSWSDVNGNLWLFSGAKYNQATYYKDLWRFNTASQMWAWMGDVVQDNASYNGLGNQGDPGNRRFMLVWGDPSGNFMWLYGGVQVADVTNPPNMISDLWKYDINAGTWIWVSGSSLVKQPAVYGTQNDNPGARIFSTTWMDAAGNLLLFGGRNYNSTVLLNDFWKYTPATNTWAWMGGSSLGNDAGVYGTLGVPSSTNIPCAREYCTASADASGNLWLFGGRFGSYYNDLWKYDAGSGQWAWMGGSNSNVAGNTYSHYGTIGVFDPLNQPGGRFAAPSWVDNSGNFWMFGGYGYDKNGQYGFLGDLWEAKNNVVIQLIDQNITFNSFGNTYTYGDANIIMNATGGPSGNVVTYKSSDTNIAQIVNGNEVKIVGAGNVTITAQQAGNALYNPAPDVGQQLIINKKNLTITSVDASRAYGATNPDFTVSYSGFVNQEDQSVLINKPSITCTADVYTSAGSTVPIVAFNATAANYSFTYVDGSLTITKANITITAANASRAYGASNPDFALTYSGFVNQEDEGVLINKPTITCTADVYTSAGSTVPIVAFNATAANYSFTYVDGSLTITKANITITAANASRAYGASNPDFAVTYSGFVNQEDEGVLVVKPTTVCAADATTPAGSTVPIVVSNAAAINYGFTYINGVLTILSTDDHDTRVLNIDQNTLDFGDRIAGIETKTLSVILGNNGNSALNVTDITLPAGYSIDKKTDVLSEGSSDAFTITFTPLLAGEYKGQIAIASDATSGNNIITVTGNGIEPEAVDGFKVYPNPFGETMAIEFYTEGEEESLINITDVLGRSMLSQWMITDKGKNRITWDGKDGNGVTQPAGMYVIDLSVGDRVMRMKVVKK